MEIIGGAALTQADSPLPGPADAGGATMIMDGQRRVRRGLAKILGSSVPWPGSSPKPQPAPRPQPSPSPSPGPSPSPCPGEDDDDLFLYRLGGSWESTGRIQRKSQESLSKTGRFGLSVSTTKERDYDISSSTMGTLNAAGFEVKHTPTQGDPGHHTVIFTDPVSSTQARAFNLAFGRKR